MGSDGNPSPQLDRSNNFGSRPALHIGQGVSETEEVSLGGGYLDSWDDQESIDRLSVGPDEPPFFKVVNRFTGIVIGDGYSAEPTSSCSLHHGLGGGTAIRRVVGVKMQIEDMAHNDSVAVEVD